MYVHMYVYICMCVDELCIAIFHYYSQSTNYRADVMDKLLDGHLKSGFRMNTPAMAGEKCYQKHTAPEHMVHYVLFILDATTTQNTDAYANRLKEFRKQLDEKGM